MGFPKSPAKKSPIPCLLCLGGGSAIGRHNRPHELGISGSAGEIELSVDWNDLPGPNGLQMATAGQTWNFQCWYRDQNPGLTSNFTDAVSLTLQSSMLALPGWELQRDTFGGAAGSGVEYGAGMLASELLSDPIHRLEYCRETPIPAD